MQVAEVGEMSTSRNDTAIYEVRIDIKSTYMKSIYKCSPRTQANIMADDSLCFSDV